MAPEDAVLRAFARLLPAEFRDRVFEPALADLRLNERETIASPGARLTARLVIIAECARLGMPQLLWRRGRPTRLGGALLAAVVISALLVQRHNYRS